MTEAARRKCRAGTPRWLESRNALRATRGAECEAGREAACKARVPHRPMHYRLPEFAREGVRPLWGH